MNTITITIGRNVGDVPLDDHRWAGFRNDIQTVLSNHYAEVYVNAAAGRGTWEGVEEENATWVASVDTAFIPGVRARLKYMADLYKQDAIALTVGDTALVTP